LSFGSFPPAFISKNFNSIGMDSGRMKNGE